MGERFYFHRQRPHALPEFIGEDPNTGRWRIVNRIRDAKMFVDPNWMECFIPSLPDQSESWSILKVIDPVTNDI
jgi:hypothetical protein